MIIQVRGTSGSGKTTVMRRVMQAYGPWEPHHVPGRRQPLLYYANTPRDRIAVVGHYEIDCGGCDTIGSAPDVYEVIKDIIEGNGDIPILSEGLLWSEDVKWTLALRDAGQAVYPFYLTTPLEECLRRVTVRQAGRAPADPERVVRKLTKRVETIDRTRPRLLEAGVPCRRCSSDQAPRLILERLRLHAQPGG